MIRPANVNDAKQIQKIYAYYVTDTAITYEYDVPSVEEMKSRLEKIMEKYPYFVVEENGVIKGYAYASAFHERAAYSHCVEVSIYLDKDEKKKGYGSALYKELEAALKKMNIKNLYACIGDPIVEDEYLTKDSERFHARMGYKKIGEFHKCGYKFDRWYNMIWMEKLIGAHD